MITFRTVYTVITQTKAQRTVTQTTFKQSFTLKSNFENKNWSWDKIKTISLGFWCVGRGKFGETVPASLHFVIPYFIKEQHVWRLSLYVYRSTETFSVSLQFVMPYFIKEQHVWRLQITVKDFHGMQVRQTSKINNIANILLTNN